MAVLPELPLESQVSVRGEPPAGFPVEPNTTADGRTGGDRSLARPGRVARARRP